MALLRRLSSAHHGALRCRSPLHRTTSASATKRALCAASDRVFRPADDEEWMKDPTHPRLKQFLQRERAYLSQLLQKDRFRKVERAFYSEFRRRLPQEDASIPERIGAYEYYMKQPPRANFPVYFRRKMGSDAAEQVVLDQNQHPMLHQDFHFILTMKISPDETSMLLVQENSHEEYRLVLQRLEVESASGFGWKKKKKPASSSTLQVLEHLGQVRNVEWCSDRAFYFTCVDDHRRPYAVYRYNLATRELLKVFEEPDEAVFVDVSSTKDNAFVLINCNSKTASEIHTLPCGVDSGPVTPVLLRAREPGTSYFADHARGRFVIVTNADGAANYKIVTSLDQHPHVWTTLVDEEPDVKIEDVDVYDRHLVIYERVRSVPRIRVRDLETGETHEVALPTQHALCRVTPGVNRCPSATTLRFSIATPLVPEIVYDYDLETRQLRVLKETRVLAENGSTGTGTRTRTKTHTRLDKDNQGTSLLDVDQFVCRREFVPSHDGQNVPLTLLHRRDLARSGDHPTLLLGYGAYGTNLEADFELEHLSLLQRGWVVALAHVRGGGELGLPWHHAGRREHKLNTFHDFVSCSRHVLAQKYTCPDRLAAKGVSAGGLIMGYVANEHPELFRALILKVPFVDILDSMQDPTLPLTVHEYDEWGNPSDPAVAAYMAQYAPCVNLKHGQKYPSMLVTGSLNDIRVPYWGPVKWVHRLRALHLAEHRPPPLLALHMSEDDGHFGGGGRLEQFQHTAIEYAFLYHALGLNFDK